MAPYEYDSNHDTPDRLYQFFIGAGYFDVTPRGKPSFDGLKINWKKRNFCNPPWDGNIRSWVEKAIAETTKGHLTVMIVPLDISTEWWTMVRYYGLPAIGFMDRIFPNVRGTVMVFFA